MRQADVELVYELSPIQQAMLFHSVAAPGSGVYVLQISLRLAGPLDRAAFARAWCHLVDRHAVLRTGFYWDELEKPVQVVYRGAELDLRQESWRGLGAEEQALRLARHLDADREEGFDLAEPPLLRLTLFELAADLHQLVWSQHHLVSDGWSQGLLLRELFTAYQAFAGGGEPALGRAGSYREYVAWLQRRDLGEAEAFWRRGLAGLAAPTYLAGHCELAQQRGEAAGFRASRRRRLVLSAAATAALREVARRRRLTLNTLVQGAWALLLAAATGARDVVFGATGAGRPAELPGVESIVGPFLNTLPVRVEVAPERRLAPWLAELQERQVELRRFEHAPLVEVQRWSGLPPGVALFDHILVFENYPLDSELARLLPGLALSGLTVNELTNYPLHVTVAPGAELSFEILYDAGRFDSTAVDRMLARLAGLLRAFAADPGPVAALGGLPLLPESERQQVVREWNDTATAVPERCLHELVARQAERTPAAIAVTATAAAGAESLSYGELARRSRRLAGRLAALGVGPEVPVGLAVERSIGMLVGLLGILEAGGAYVPIDPDYPPERIRWMLEDSRAPVLVTQGRLAARLPRLPALRQVLLDEAMGGGGETGPVRRALPESAAYAIYTSGSTGRPKGVLVPHRALVNFLAVIGRRLQLGRAGALLAVTSLSFDIAAMDLFLPLLEGGRAIVADRATAADGARLAELAERSGAAGLQATPATWRLLLEGDWPGGDLAALCGGEALQPALLAALLPRVGALWNLYGPTETTVWSSAWRAEAGERISIGRPLGNVRHHVVDRELQPVPIGAAGELAIGGAGIARGYLGRPELTAAAFVPDPFGPFGDAPGARLYRTGDLARLLPDGGVEILGRLDRQVKIRGFRIEPEEVEAVLASHRAVRGCAVVAREDVPGLPLLAAYVAADPGSLRGTAGLRAHLAERLPDYMVPAVFVVLDALPLTPNAKVDRRALPVPERTAGEGPADSSHGPMDPLDPIEELLASLWGEILGLENVGRDDDFFVLGGHSLLATRVASGIRGAMGVELPLRRLFEARTLAALAAEVRQARREDLPRAPPIERPTAQPGDGEPPLSFAQQRLWFLDQLEPGNPAYHVPVAVRLAGELRADLLARVFAEVARRQEGLRTTFAAPQGRPVQVVAAAWRPELPVVDLSGLPVPEAAARPLALAAARRPFDLARGPVLRLGLLRLAAREHLLLATMHHAVSDGWSVGVLLREIAALYGAFAAGAPSPLPELPVQYADYARWQRSWLAGEVLAAQLAHWKGRLAGAPPALELPADRPRPAAQTYRGAARPAALSPALVAALRNLCRQQSVTPFMTLLAAWAAVLGRHAGQEDVVVGTPVAGRSHREVEGLIGCFVNTLALRADLAGAPSFGELLARLRETALDAYAHQDLPFERLVDELVPARDLARPPLVQVMFLLQAAAFGEEAREVAGLTLRPLALHRGAAQFELTLALHDGPAGIAGFLEHNADLFDATTAERLLARFTALLEAVVADPDLPLAELPPLPAGERHQTVVEWNDTATARGAGWLLHELVAAQAARTPRAVAAVCAGEALDYGELDRRADRLAHRLLAAGAGPGARVGVLLERSLEMIVGLLGVLKAGAAYVPLDPSHPAERLALLAAGAGVRAVLAHERLASLLPRDGAVPVLLLAAGGASEEHLPATPSEVAARVVTEDDLAYVLYTSGSTGTPKGVMIPHRGIVNRLLWMQEAYGLTPEDRVLQKTPLGFDVSLWELFWPLLAGARLVFARPEGHRDPLYLTELIERERITVLHFVPSMLQAFLEAPGVAGLASPRLVVASGEALTPELVRRCRARLSGAALHNLYGPTEASVDVSAWAAVLGPAGPAGATVPIGRPIANCRLYVVDRELAPRPIGAPGELVIGGAGLARGYLGRPELTAEAFVPDPFARDRTGSRLDRTGDPARLPPGGRLYRTGDLARLLPDGNLEFLGRLDHQVKIRGFRVEPGEIEAVLGDHPAVRECAVVLREDAPGVRRLVAYVVAAEAGADPADLRSYLGGKLPDAMVPAAFVPLDALPLTPSGKLDRRALPVPPKGKSGAEGEDEVPRTAAETALAAIWSQVLGVERVGRRDNFFDLGGDSILAIQIVFLARQAGFGIDPKDVFRHQTLGDLAAAAPPAAASAEDAAAAPPAPRRATAAEALTPADFPEARTTQKDLDKLLALAGKRAGKAGEAGSG